MDKFILLPNNLSSDQLDEIEAYFAEHNLGHIEKTVSGLMIRMEDHVTEDDALKHVNAICAQLKLCLICGQPINWNGNAWRHDSAKSFGVNPCTLQDRDLPIPPPIPTDESTDKQSNVTFTILSENVGLDAAVGVERMMLIGHALRYGFGSNWLKERDD